MDLRGRLLAIKRLVVGGARPRKAIRHNASTELRKEFGIEAARIILGHHSVAVTEIYAQKDEQEAIAAIMKVG